MLVLLLLLGAGQDVPRVKPLDVQSWVTDDDYPALALRAGEEGTVGFDLTLAGDGTVERCDVTSSSNSQTLDTTTCALLSKRARFSTPKAGLHYRGRFTWKIPPTPLQPIAWSHIAATLRLSADDRVLECKETVEGTVPDAMKAPCEEAAKGLPQGMLEAIGGMGTPRVLTMEYSNWFGADRAIAGLYAKPGQIVLGRRQIRFDIAETGKVENCRDVPTGQEGILEGRPSPCTTGIDPFAPPLDAAGKPHATTGTMEVAISKTP